MEVSLEPGAVVWARLSPTEGREQGGHRPVLVVSSPGHLMAVTTLLVGLPITGRQREWPNHVAVDGPSGLDRPSWVMTEQPRTLARHRVTSPSGAVSPACLAAVRVYLGDFLDL